MSKKQYEFEQLQKTVERYRKLSTEIILQRLNLPLLETHAKACKAVLKERGIKK